MCRSCCGEAFVLPEGETLQSCVGRIPRAPDCDCPCAGPFLAQVDDPTDGIQSGEVRCLECDHPLSLSEITPEGTLIEETVVGSPSGRFYRAVHSDEVDELNALLGRSNDQ